jgi:alpha-glucosidase
VACFWTIAPGDRFYGLGEKAGPLKKNGQSVKMWNTDAYAWGPTTDPLYVSVPFFLSARTGTPWGLFLDNPTQTFFNLGRDDDTEARVGAVDGPLDLWVFSAPDVPHLVAEYTGLTGRISLLPAWALGYQQSKYSYATQDEVLATARTFVEKHLPARAIYLDIDYMDAYRDFTFDKTAFPDPKAMVDDLHRMGFRVVAIVDPGILAQVGNPVFDDGLARDVFLRNGAGDLLTGKVWPGVCAFPDFRKADVARWWGAQYRVLTDVGIDGFWNDMNEPSVFDGPGGTLSLEAPMDRLHNLYGDRMVQATRAGLEALRPGVRPFVLSRDGYAGTQRTAVVWTGDNSANWDHLKLNLTMVLNLGLSGYPVTGADVGGYKGNPTPELLVRWMQLGAFLPLYRNHTEKGHDGHEPWKFGPEAEALSQAALEFRRGLEPYLYDLVREASMTGAPLVRPLFWSFPEDPESAKPDDEFLLGESLLVAPVLEAGARQRTLWLPAGADWYQWSTGRKYSGGQRLTLPVDLSSVPVFARAGTVVPWSGAAGLEYRVFPGKGPAHTSYFDDGETLAYTGGASVTSRVQAPAEATGIPLWTTVDGDWEGAPKTASGVFPDGRRVELARS